jgi:hypothetical protein
MDYARELAKYDVDYKEEAVNLLQATLTSWTSGVALHVASAIFISGCLLKDFPLLFKELSGKSGSPSKIHVFQAVVKLMELLSFQYPSLKKRVKL